VNAWWFLTRATGIVATLLAVASLGWGFLFSARQTGTRRSPAWWLDLHNWLGGLALAFTVAHLMAAVVDGLGPVDALVPRTSTSFQRGLAWGVVAFWAFLVTVVTSWRPVKRRLSRRGWHGIHLISVPAVVLAIVHGYASGSDATTVAFQGVLVLVAGAAVYPTALRLFGLRARRTR
jgi:DMSO/TMAO reductase YedYZ heme-binding membrane subunit